MLINKSYGYDITKIYYYFISLLNQISGFKYYYKIERVKTKVSIIVFTYKNK